MNNNLIQKKSFDFSLLIIKLFKELAEKKEYMLSRQLMRSGTSIGANVCKAQSAESKEDFIHKMSISLKEARETEYWLKLMYYADFIRKDRFDFCMSELDV